jgi:hypothetical protein
MNTRPPEPSSARSVWTIQDEARLQELMDRKKRIYDEHMAFLMDSLRPIVQLLMYNSELPNEHIALQKAAEAAISNAPAITQALKPFIVVQP